MFDLFSWSHVLILLTVALVVVGPKDLPRMMHMAGKWAGKARAMANEFKSSFDEMARQTELAELRKEIDNLRNHPGLSDIAAAVNQPVDVMAVETGPAAETSPEPRVGEFQVTETPPQPIMAGDKPPSS
jgi:sec-independent protein translocase protein TatB